MARFSAATSQSVSFGPSPVVLVCGRADNAAIVRGSQPIVSHFEWGNWPNDFPGDYGRRIRVTFNNSQRNFGFVVSGALPQSRTLTLTLNRRQWNVNGSVGTRETRVESAVSHSSAETTGIDALGSHE